MNERTLARQVNVTVTTQLRYRETKPADEAEWLAARWKNGKGEARITASVAGVVHGVHPYKTVADFATELLADTAPQPNEGNADTQRGNMIEPFIRRVAEIAHGIELVEPKRMFAYEEPGVRLMATVDAMTNIPDGEPQRVFEIKSWRGYWVGQLKPEWVWQGVQLAICCDVEQIEWAIFDSSLQVHHHVQYVSSDERQYHIDKCREFLKYIDDGEYPPDAVFTYDHIKDRYPQGESMATVELPAEMLGTFERLAFAKVQQKEAKLIEDLCKAEITEAMGTAEFATVDGVVVATWKTSTATKFDQKAFTEAHPALAEKFKKQTTVRTFLPKIKGK